MSTIKKIARTFALVIVATFAVMLFGSNVNAATNESQLFLQLPSCEHRFAVVEGTAPADGIYALKVNEVGTDNVRVVDNQKARLGEPVRLVAPEYPGNMEITYSVTLSGPDDTSGVVLVDFGTAARPTDAWCANPPAVG